MGDALRLDGFTTPDWEEEGGADAAAGWAAAAPDDEGAAETCALTGAAT